MGGFLTETVTKVVGSLDLELSAAASVASLTLAIAGAVGVDRQYVFVSFWAVVVGSSPQRQALLFDPWLRLSVLTMKLLCLLPAVPSNARRRMWLLQRWRFLSLSQMRNAPSVSQCLALEW